MVPFNIVFYNIFAGPGRGPDIYGTEPWSRAEGESDQVNRFVDAVLVARPLAELVRSGFADVLGPLPVDEKSERLLVRVPRAHGGALARAIADVQRDRSLRDEPVVRVRLDPTDIG